MNDTKSTIEEQEEFIKKLEDKATERGLSLSEYVAVTGGDEMREVLRRIIEGVLQEVKNGSN